MPNLIGSGPQQIPTNQLLGRMAFQNPGAVVLEPAATAAPTRPGDMVFQYNDLANQLTIKVMGSDGVVRSNTLTLA